MSVILNTEISNRKSQIKYLTDINEMFQTEIAMFYSETKRPSGKNGIVENN